MTAIPHVTESRKALEALARASVLYTDLDGTLLGPTGSLLTDGAGEPAATAAEAIVAVNRAGLDVRITSGRNRRQLTEVTRVCGWRGFIAELGCVIVHDRGERPVYYTGAWPEGTVEPGDTLYEMIERAGALRALSDLFPGRVELHDPWHVDREATHVLRGNVDVEAGRAALAALPVPVDLIDNGIIHPPRHTLVDVDEVHAYHLVPAGVTKEGAVARDLSHRGLGAADAIAIGDSATDVAMADAVALMVVVGNSLDDARAVEAARGRENVVHVSGRRGDGWAELAQAWLHARGTA